MKTQFLGVALAILITTTGLTKTLESSKTASGILMGKVQTPEGTPIPDANITVSSTTIGTASADGGFYSMSIPQGTYTIYVSAIGYQSESNQVVIEEDQRKYCNFVLKQIPIPMSPVIVTATQTHHIQRHVTVSSQILTSSEIRQKIGYTTGDIIQQTDGTQIKDYGGLAGIKTISIRGSNDGHSLILIDNQKLNLPQIAGVDLNIIPSLFLDRIEIIRGGHSALYGSDAVGGVIHLITRESIPPKGFQWTLQGSTGSYGTNELNLTGIQKVGSLQFSAGYNHIESIGNFIYRHPDTGADSTRKNNQMSGDNYFLKITWEPDPQTKILFSHLRFLTNREVAGSTTYPSPLANRNDNKSLASLQIDHRIHQFQFKVQGFYQYDRQHYKDPGSWIPIDSKHKNTLMGMKLLAFWTRPHFTWMFGNEEHFDRIESSDVGDHRRNTIALYSQIEWDRNFDFSGRSFHTLLVPSIRWDRFDGSNSQTCPKIGALLQTGGNNRWTTRVNLSSSFHMPTFNDLFWPNDGWSYGNPDLQPEKGTSMDYGLSFERIGKTYFSISSTCFQNRIQDLILWSEAAPWVYSPVNVGNVQIHGLENIFSIHFQNNASYLRLSHTYLQAIDKTSGSPSKGNRIQYRPDHEISASAGFSFGNLSANIFYGWVDKRYSNAENTELIPSSFILNANIQIRLKLIQTQLAIGFHASNLLDEQYVLLKGYPIPGREFRMTVGLTY